MIVIQGEIRVHPDDVPALRTLAAPLVAGTHAEPGNEGYAFSEDLLDPGLVHIIERWADEAALAGHQSAPHLAAFSMEVVKLRVLGLKIVGYDSPGGRVLMSA
jgi:quinol monooxygenase YgiN